MAFFHTCSLGIPCLVPRRRFTGLSIQSTGGGRAPATMAVSQSGNSNSSCVTQNIDIEPERTLWSKANGIPSQEQFNSLTRSRWSPAFSARKLSTGSAAGSVNHTAPSKQLSMTRSKWAGAKRLLKRAGLNPARCRAISCSCTWSSSGSGAIVLRAAARVSMLSLIFFCAASAP